MAYEPPTVMNDVKHPDHDFIKECITEIFLSNDELDDDELGSIILLHISRHGWDADVSQWAIKQMNSEYSNLQNIFED